jgi:thioredoxin reductase
VEDGAVLVGEALDDAPRTVAQSAPRVVVLGAGAAGLACVDELLRLGHDGPLTLIDREADPLYERTTLSKDFLRGTADRTAIRRIERDELECMGVTVRFGEEVQSVVPDLRHVRLRSGEAVAYDLCFAAPGAAARRLDLPGAELEGVVTLRSAEDAEAILDAAHDAGRCLVVGGGFIGLEASAALAQAGVSVRLVVRGAAPGEKRLGPDLAALVGGKLQEMGVEVTTCSEPEAFEGEHGRLSRMRLSNGEAVETSLALLAVGEARHGGLIGAAERTEPSPSGRGSRQPRACGSAEMPPRATVPARATGALRRRKGASLPPPCSDAREQPRPFLSSGHRSVFRRARWSASTWSGERIPSSSMSTSETWQGTTSRAGIWAAETLSARPVRVQATGTAATTLLVSSSVACGSTRWKRLADLRTRFCSPGRQPEPLDPMEKERGIRRERLIVDVSVQRQVHPEHGCRCAARSPLNRPENGASRGRG